MSHHYFLCDKEQTHDFQSPSHHKPGLIWSLSITSHHIKVKVMCLLVAGPWWRLLRGCIYSLKHMLPRPSRRPSVWQSLSFYNAPAGQSAKKKKKKKKDLPCANKTADAHSRTQPFIISVYLLPVAVPDKNLAFTAICSGQGVSRAGCMALWVVQYEFRCASFHLNRKYECHTEERGWFNSLQWEATGLWVM